MNPPYKIKSNAKINLGLKVLNKRIDGFHNIDSIFIEINLFDYIIFQENKTYDLQCNNTEIEFKKNTIHKVYMLMKEKYNFKKNYEIVLEKNIPLYSGLGGGSSNAASTIKMLNQLNQLNLSKNEMFDIALQIGSDVPYFIDGGIKHISGRGEIIEKYSESQQIQPLFALLVIPEFSISTEWAYNKIKKYLEPRINRPKFPTLKGVEDWKLFENDFEKVLELTYPEIMDIKSTMYKCGALYSGLSGSGSTMFGLYNNAELINRSIDKLSMYKTHIASPV